MRHCLLSFLLLLSAIPAAFASAPDPQSPSCGATVADALKQARLSLASPEAGSERVALTCLIEAVGDMEADKSEAVRSDGTHVVAVPVYKNGAP